MGKDKIIEGEGWELASQQDPAALAGNPATPPSTSAVAVEVGGTKLSEVEGIPGDDDLIRALEAYVNDYVAYQNDKYNQGLVGTAINGPSLKPYLPYLRFTIGMKLQVPPLRKETAARMLQGINPDLGKLLQTSIGDSMPEKVDLHSENPLGELLDDMGIILPGIGHLYELERVSTKVTVIPSLPELSRFMFHGTEFRRYLAINHVESPSPVYRLEGETAQAQFQVQNIPIQGADTVLVNRFPGISQLFTPPRVLDYLAGRGSEDGNKDNIYPMIQEYKELQERAIKVGIVATMPPSGTEFRRVLWSKLVQYHPALIYNSEDGI